MDVIEFDYRAPRPQPQVKMVATKCVRGVQVRFTEIVEDFSQDLTADATHPVFKPEHVTPYEWMALRRRQDSREWDEWTFWGAD